MSGKKLTTNGLIFLFLVFSFLESTAQGANPFMTDAASRPLFLRTNYIAEGSPYLFEDYKLAEVTLENDKVYPNIKAKFNLVERELVYMDDNGEEMVATTPVKSIRFFSAVINGSLQSETILVGDDKPINTASNDIFILLADGKGKLMKKISVTYTDQKKYGEATITRTFRRKETNYAKMPDSKELTKVEKNKSDILVLFGKKQAQVSNFIEQNNLKCKSDEDLIQVFKYYNSL